MNFLPYFFESLTSALPENAQLILVDDGSTERVFETVPEIPKASEVLRLRNENNLGYSIAVNRAFAVSSGDIIIQLNTDLILQPNTLKAMIDLIERERSVGIVGSKLIFPTTHLIQHIGMAFGQFTKPHVFFELPSNHPLCEKSRECQITTSATVAMTRDVLPKIGPLDERYFNCNEDIDHCLKALRSGLRNFVCAESISYHWESQSGPSRFARVEASEAIFWADWGGAYEIDLGKFVDEALDHVMCCSPSLGGTPFDVLNLSRGVDESIVLERISSRWPKVVVRDHRQLNNPVARLWLPMILPHWIVHEPKPFIYVVDHYRELEDNALWFRTRRGIVDEELIVDLSGAAVTSSEVFGS